MQGQEPVYVHFSEKNGLPDKEFYDLFEDSKGFIWVCADKGLFRYNGKNYKSYSNNLQRALSVFNAQEDHLGRIWCNNVSGQFFYTENNELQLFADLSKELRGQLAEFIIKKEYLWVFAYYKTYKINLKTKKIEYTHSLPRKIKGAPFVFKDAIYFGSIDSIYSITPKNNINRIVPVGLPFKDKSGKKIGVDQAIIFKIDSTLFFRQKRNGINRFFHINKKKKEVNVINGFEAIARERIYHQFENNNEIWFATGTGVWVYEYKKQSFKLKKRFLKKNDVTKIVKDNDANYWFTTLNDGIYVIPNINIEKATISNENKNISSLDVINDSTLVFGNTKGNIGFYNTKTDSISIIDLPTKDRVSVLKYFPSKNTVFISKDFGGFTFNMKSFELNKISGLSTAKSLTILNNKKLLYTSNSGVNISDETGLNNVVIDKDQGGKRTYTSYYNTTNKSVYIAYVDNLLRYDSLWNSKPIRYNNKSIDVKSITKTTNGVIWVSTFKDGVIGIKNDSIIHHYSIENGLTSNKIGMVKADHNQLWITLDNSIQLLDIKTKKIQTLTKREGVVSYDISGIEILKNKVYFSSNEGLFSINKEQPFKNENPEVYFNTVEINESDTLIASNYSLKYDQNAIKIGFNVNGFLYNQKRKYNYRLKGFNNQWLTTDQGANSVKYNSLPAGKYTFEVQPIIDEKFDVNKIKAIDFTINKPFWKTWWFILGIFVFFIGSTILYFRKKIKKDKKERLTELEKISLEKELISINLTALRSQMNPHFIFNALNSIQDLILKQDTDASYDYIVLFAQLVRNTLVYSSQDFISIDKELDFLNVYLQLEKLRFGDDFNYTIHFDEKESLEVPSLLIQPFIENALVHGLMHKAGKKELHIVFSFAKNVLQCTITDNGIGRVKSTEISNRQGNHHKSFALNAIEKRLEIFKKQYAENIGYVIEDLYENEIAKGTKVILTMPYKNRF
ncbi:sensor histidine kinase [Lacinutrix jangbogonensis]|uniref:sensor histidine kinase n=1 Tax=Lacinutrix jangbogonensis TaxID=1469557 RepID=UPI00053CF282|nr:histidine kinase [Lacinutrix jangbogonensis]